MLTLTWMNQNPSISISIKCKKTSSVYFLFRGPGLWLISSLATTSKYQRPLWVENRRSNNFFLLPLQLHLIKYPRFLNHLAQYHTIQIIRRHVSLGFRHTPSYSLSTFVWRHTLTTIHHNSKTIVMLSYRRSKHWSQSCWMLARDRLTGSRAWGVKW